MPELPEVETVVRDLQAVLPGNVIASVEVVRADLVRSDLDAFTSALRGRTVVRVRRRAKNILIDLRPDSVLVVHLGMTGSLLPTEPGGPAPRATHPGVHFHFVGGARMVYDDVRRFGSLELLNRHEWEARERRIGPEPLEDPFDRESWVRTLRASRSPIRSWLLDPRRIAGVGNIYACEALFRAGIHPRRRGHRIRKYEGLRLQGCVRAVLSEAVEGRGTTLRNYRDASGEEGAFGGFLQVYGREGEPCVDCGTPVARITFGGRSAYLCPECQPRNGPSERRGGGEVQIGSELREFGPR